MARKHKNPKRGPWTKDEIKYLRKYFGSQPTVSVALNLGRGIDPTKKKASRLGLRKSVKYLKSLGRTR